MRAVPLGPETDAATRWVPVTELDHNALALALASAKGDLEAWLVRLWLDNADQLEDGNTTLAQVARPSGASATSSRQGGSEAKNA